MGGLGASVDGNMRNQIGWGTDRILSKLTGKGGCISGSGRNLVPGKLPGREYKDDSS